MQVDTYQKHEVITSPGFDDNTMDFGVKNPALIFDILCNRMYQNPVRTMIQEYMSNGRDAHREAGKELTPIEVTLPTYLDSTLRIRDFGPGLTPERIEDVFVFLGESTKRADDTQTGGFGVGAKVGWAYSDSFTVVSIVDGTERTYLAFLGEENVGKLALVNTQETEEAQGVEIQITIKQEDISAVTRGVQHVCHFWETQPVVHNAQDTVTFYKGSRHEPVLVDVPNCSEKAMAIVDGIPYPLDATSAGHLKDIKIPQNSYLTACLFFNTGDLDLAVNREGLRYSDKTITAISMHIDECAEKTERLIENVKQHKSINAKLDAMQQIFNGIVTSNDLLVDVGTSTDENDPKVRLSCQFGRSELRFGKGSDITIYTAFVNNSVQTGISTKRAKSTYGYNVSTVRLDTSKTYCVILGNSVPSKARMRTLFDTSNIERTKVVATTNPYVFKTLVEGGFVDLDMLKKTTATRGFGGMGYADTDVKSINDRSRTRALSEMDPKKHSWCTFKECGEMRDKYSTFDLRRMGCHIYYVTTEQMKYIEQSDIPHASEVFVHAYKRACAALSYKIQTASTTKLRFPYSCPSGADTLVAKLRDCADARFEEACVLAERHALQMELRSAYNKVQNMHYVLRKRRSNRQAMLYNKQCEAIERQLKVLTRSIYNDYPLFRYISTYNTQPHIAEELAVYVNGKNGRC